jgi:hypothetical protein
MSLSRELTTIANLLEHYGAKHAPRLADANDRAYFDLLHDVRETPAIEDLNGDAGVSISRADDQGDVYEVENRVARFDQF